MVDTLNTLTSSEINKKKERNRYDRKCNRNRKMRKKKKSGNEIEKKVKYGRINTGFFLLSLELSHT